MNCLYSNGRAWEDWGRRVQVDLDALRWYARAVYAETDEFLSRMPDGELEREIDLTGMGFGRQTARFVIANMLQNVALHCGEIAVLKGLNGASGYSYPVLVDQQKVVISQGTVEVHVKHILSKLGFASRKQVAEWVTSGGSRRETGAAFSLRR